MDSFLLSSLCSKISMTLAIALFSFCSLLQSMSEMPVTSSYGKLSGKVSASGMSRMAELQIALTVSENRYCFLERASVSVLNFPGL